MVWVRKVNQMNYTQAQVDALKLKIFGPAPV